MYTVYTYKCMLLVNPTYMLVHDSWAATFLLAYQFQQGTYLLVHIQALGSVITKPKNEQSSARGALKITP